MKYQKLAKTSIKQKSKLADNNTEVLMKLFVIPLLLFLHFSNSWSAEKQDQATYANEDTKTSDKKDQLINLFLEYPAVKPVYESCLKKQKDKSLNISLAECVWKEVDDKTKNELKNAISSVEHKKNISRDPANEKKLEDPKEKNKAALKENQSRNYEGVDLGTVTPYKGDKALLKVEDFLVKRLEESLLGVDPKVTKIVDHQKFHSLYQSQVGKNILHALSGYCVEAKMFENPDIGLTPSTFLIEEDESKITENRKINISLLTKFDEKGENEVYSVWQSCVRNIKNICYREPGLNGVDYSDQKILVENSYSHNRACLVTHYIREHRQNLINTEAIQKKMDEFTKSKPNISFSADVTYYDYGRGEKEEDLNQLTNLSSREFYDAYKGKAKEVSEEFDKKCLEEKNQEECKKYLIVGKNKEELTKELAEFELKKKVMDEKIKSIRSPAEIKQYLKEEGYKNDAIDFMIGDSTDEQVIRDAIERHYEKEKNSLIAAINQQLEKSTSSNDEITFEADGTNVSDMATLAGISKDLKSNGKRYQEMMHFSNIVSSFLSIFIEGETQSTRNTASLFRELEHEKNASKDRAPADDTFANGSDQLVDVTEMEKKAREAGVTETKEEDDPDKRTNASTLDVKVINANFLDYGPNVKVLPESTPEAEATPEILPEATP